VSVEAETVTLVLLLITTALTGLVYINGQVTLAKTEAERRVAELKAEMEADMKKELARLDKRDDQLGQQIEGFSQVSIAVVKMGSAIEHLTEKLGDHQRSQDRALDELKHTIRNVETKLSAQRAIARRQQTGEKK
jgi:hypothetical protein